MRRTVIFLGLLLFFFIYPVQIVCAKEDSKTQDPVTDEAAETVSSITDTLDFSQIDSFLSAQEKKKVSFKDLVHRLIDEGLSSSLLQEAGSLIVDSIVQEVRANRTLLVQVILLAFCFSVLRNFTGAFAASYISELCFLLVYCVICVLLFQSFFLLEDLVKNALENCVDFMKVFVPSFCISMIFSSSVNTATQFYQTAFFLIYLVEWLFESILFPMVHIYVVIEDLDHFLEGENFKNLTELLYDCMNGVMKLVATVVLGLNIVQNMILPAKDALSQGLAAKVTSILPGVGDAVRGTMETMIGTGMVVKAGIGAAGLVVLTILILGPLIKGACMAFCYKIAAVITQPVTDKRIAGCIKGVANGAVLYLKLLFYCQLLFFLTIALSVQMTGSFY